MTLQTSGQIELGLRPAEEAEVEVLADRLASIYKRLVEGHRLKHEITAAQANEEVQAHLTTMMQELSGDEMGVGSMSPQEVSWYHLTTLAEHDPEAMMRCWQAINQAALDEFVSGYRDTMAQAQTLYERWLSKLFSPLTPGSPARNNAAEHWHT